jgi:cobalamin biosynthesis protein CobT
MPSDIIRMASVIDDENAGLAGFAGLAPVDVAAPVVDDDDVEEDVDDAGDDDEEEGEGKDGKGFEPAAPLSVRLKNSANRNGSLDNGAAAPSADEEEDDDDEEEEALVPLGVAEGAAVISAGKDFSRSINFLISSFILQSYHTVITLYQ